MVVDIVIAGDRGVDIVVVADGGDEVVVSRILSPRVKGCDARDRVTAKNIKTIIETPVIRTQRPCHHLCIVLCSVT